MNPLHPNISIHVLHTAIYTFPKVLTRRICSTIKSFSWWLSLIFSWSQMNDSAVSLWGQTRCWLLLGFKELNYLPTPAYVANYYWILFIPVDEVDWQKPWSLFNSSLRLQLKPLCIIMKWYCRITCNSHIKFLLFYSREKCQHRNHRFYTNASLNWTFHFVST